MPTEKKRLIRILDRKGGSNIGYGISSPHFAFVSIDKDERRQACSWLSCREYLTRVAYCSKHNTNFSSYYIPGTDNKVDFEKLRLLYTKGSSGSEETRKKLFIGKAILNLFERINDWSPSVISTVKHKSVSSVWLITGPAEWMAHPQMLSLVTWVLRFSSIVELDASSIEAFQHSLSEIIRAEKKNSEAGHLGGDYYYANQFLNNIVPILENYNNIFGKLSLDEAWPLPNTDEMDIPTMASRVGIYGGLSSFLKGEAKYSDQVKEAYKINQQILKRSKN